MGVEWRGRSDFAEVAEALGVPTDLIMGALHGDAGSVIVTYTPDPGDLDSMTGATLRRDASGVLVVVSRQPVDARIRQAIRDALNPDA